jgi:hypothetical protein
MLSPALTPAASANTVNGMACYSNVVSLSDCIAVGDGGELFTYNGSAWVSSNIDGSNNITSVACYAARESGSIGDCIVGDSAGQIGTNVSGSWTFATKDSGNSITALGCTEGKTESICFAGDSAGRVGVDPTAGTWSFSSQDSGHSITSIDCSPNATFIDTCMMGDNGGRIGTDSAAATPATGETWTFATKDGTNAIDAESCYGNGTKASECIAGDSAGEIGVNSDASRGGEAPTATWSWTTGSPSPADAGHTVTGLACYGSGTTESDCIAADSAGQMGTDSGTNNWSWAAVSAWAPGGALSAPGNLGAPGITGTQVQGDTLTLSNGSWSGNPAPTYTYQWHRGTASTCTSASTSISGATSTTYALQSADVGDEICGVVTATNSQGSASATSAATGDIGGPVVNTITLASQSGGGSYLSGTTLYYQGGVSGSLKLSDAVSAGTGTESSATFGALGGTSTGFSFSGSTPTTPSGGPFKSNTLSWSSSATSEPTESVTGTDSAGDTTSTTLTLTDDTTAPTGGALTVNGVAATSGGSTSTSGSTSFAIGSRTEYADSAPGLASSVLTIQSATENASTQACGAAGSGGPYTSATTITGTTQPSITDDSCYIYKLTGTDDVGNTASVSTTVAVLAVPGASTAPTVSDSSSSGYDDNDSLVTTNGSFSGSVGSYSYQWRRGTPSSCTSSSTAISGATSSTYTAQAADVGDEICATVTATNAAGSATSTSAGTVAISALPVGSVSAPRLTGQPVVGQALSTSNGTWSGAPAPTYAYQWYDCDNGGDSCSAISGATSQSYTVGSSDLGQALRAVVTATNAAGSATSTSNLTAEADPAPSASAIYGNGADGSITLDTSSGITESGGTDYTCAVDFASCATGSTYTLDRDINATDFTVDSGVTLDTNGYIIYATESFTVASGALVEASGTSGASSSNGVAGIASGTLGGSGASGAGGQCGSSCALPGTSAPSVSPSIGGAGGSGGAGNGTSPGSGGSITTPSAGGNPPSTVANLTYLAADLGGSGGGGGGTGVSNNVGDYGGGGGAGGGIVEVQADSLTNNGAIEAKGGAGGAGGESYTSGGGGGGGGGDVYLIYTSLAGSGTTSAAGGSAGSGGSGSNGIAGGSGHVEQLQVPAPGNEVLPALSGTATDGQTLTTTNGTWSTTPDSYSYQWQDCNTSGGSCANISGATSSSYTLQTSDVGDTVRSVVTAYTPAGSGVADSGVSAEISAIPPSNSQVPTVTGTDADGSVLSTTTGTWSGAPTPTYTYQWQRCNTSGASCTNISGATSSSYTLTGSDVGHDIVSVVTASNASSHGGSAVAASSAATAEISAVPPSNSSAPTVTGTDTDGSTLSTTTGTWSGAPTPTYSYQWCTSAIGSGLQGVCPAGYDTISGATSSTHALTDSDVGATIVAVVTASNASSYGGAAVTASSAPTSEISAIAPVNTKAPSVSPNSNLEDGEQLTATTGTWTGTPTPTYSYQWQDCNASGEACANISGATSAKYTLADSDVGSTIVAVVTATNASYHGGAAVSASSAATSVVPSLVSNSAPSVSGTDTDGSTLTTTNGSWSGPSPSYAYQWQRCNTSGASCANISGATSSTYALADGDVGHTIVSVVTASNSGGSLSSASTATSIVQAVAPSNTQAPSISGTDTDTDTLTASPGTWSGAPAPTYSYQWQRDSGSGSSYVNISGATSSSYTLTASDLGYSLQVVVTASNSSYTGGGSATATSAPTSDISALAPSNTHAPVVSGTDYDTYTLSATLGTWTAAPPASYSYQWQRCNTSGEACANISGATSSTYTLADSDVGSTIVAVVTASNTSYYGGTATSASSQATSEISAVGPSVISGPSISGTDEDGDALTASPGTWSGAPAPTYSYQWERCNASGEACASISGATSEGYTLTDSDVGSTIRVVATASNASHYGGSSAQATSSPTSTISASNLVSTEAPVVTGTDKDGFTLSTTNGTWTGAPAPTYTYQWERCNASGAECAAIPGATSTTYTLTDSDVGHKITSVVTATNPSAPASASSAPTPTIDAVVPANSLAPAITGTDADGSTLSASTGTWTGAPAPTYSYQWQACNASGGSCTSISGATTSTYTLADSNVGQTIVVVVTASNSSYAGGSSSSAASAPTSVIQAVGPVSTLAPSVTGTDTDTDTLTASSGTWSGAPAPTYSYQWQRDSGSGSSYVNISGATASTYTLTDADVGYSLQVVVTASNASYTGGSPASAASAPTSEISALVPANTQAPSISGTAADGDVLTASPGTWSGAPAPTYSYQWQDCNSSGHECAAISGATASTYTLTDSDVGSTVVVVITASNASYHGGGSTSASSSATAQIAASGVVNTQAPAISGTTQDGDVLTATTGTWDGQPTPSFAYQWQRCNTSGADCADISGATSSTYTLQGPDIGSTVVVVVTGTNASGSTPASSSPTAVITASPPVSTSAPTISGTAKDSDTLTGTNGTWTGAPAPTYTYQWQRCNGSGAECADISGATSITYALADEDLGHTMALVVTADNSSYAGGAATSASSAATSSVTALAPSNTELPAISGGDAEGDVLTASDGAWSGAPAPTYAYQWQRCNSAGAGCTSISGATSSTYTAQASDVGSTIRVAVTASNSSFAGGGSATATSDQTGTIATSNPVNTQAPAITGTTKDSETLTGSNGTWTGSPTSYSYQWERCNTSGTSCVDIVGANASTYTLTDTDLDHTMRIVVTADEATSATSSPTSEITALAPANIGLPVVSGTTADGQILTASEGSWTGAPASTYSYQWEDCNTSGGSCTSISGATGTTYTLQASDVGHDIRVAVTASNAIYTGGAAVTAASAAVGPVEATSPVNTSLPYVTGTTQDGSVLTAQPGSWTGEAPITYSYQWESCNSEGGSCADVGGATSQTYLLGHSDVGTTLRVVVTATNTGGSTEATSGQSGVIQALTPTVAIDPAISGLAEDRLPLTVSNGTWDGTPPFTYSYQWHRGTPSSCTASGTDVGTNSNTYTPDFADVGDEVCVVVSASNSSLPGGGTASFLAGPTSPVSGSTQILITNGQYATSVNNSQHVVYVAPGTTGSQLASNIQPIDQTTQEYDISGQTPSSSALTDSSKLDVRATDPAEQEYEVIVASSEDCSAYPYGCTSGPVGYTPAYSESLVTGSVESGTLSLTPAAYESWSTRLSATGDTVASYSDPIDTNDNRGSGQGWHETVTSTSYVGRSVAGTAATAGPPPEGPGDSGDQGLSSSDNPASGGTPFTFGVSGTPIDSSITAIYATGNTGSTDTTPEDGLPTPIEIPQAATAPTPAGFYEAAHGTGLGNFTLTPSVSVAVPANAYNGYYSSVVTLAIVSGP